jgi:hypothetical protein
MHILSTSSWGAPWGASSLVICDPIFVMHGAIVTFNICYDLMLRSINGSQYHTGSSRRLNKHTKRFNTCTLPFQSNGWYFLKTVISTWSLLYLTSNIINKTACNKLIQGRIKSLKRYAFIKFSKETHRYMSAD